MTEHGMVKCSDPGKLGKLEWTAAAALPNTRRDRALGKKEMQPAHSRTPNYSRLSAEKREELSILMC